MTSPENARDVIIKIYMALGFFNVTLSVLFMCGVCLALLINCFLYAPSKYKIHKLASSFSIMFVKSVLPKNLYISVLTAYLATFIGGIVTTWTSPSLPRLNGSVDPENNPLKNPTTHFEDSWIASILTIGGICSSFLAGIGSDKLGRKRALLLATIPMFLGFILTAFAFEVWHFYLARYLCGLSIGAIFVIIPNYVAEISEKSNRGSLSCLMSASATFGHLFIYSIGPYLPINYTSLICIILLALYFILFFTYALESPYYLIAKNDIEGAKINLNKLRVKSNLEVAKEFEEIEKVVRDSYTSKISVFDAFKSKSNLKRLFIVLGLMMFKQMSGFTCILFYLQKIFQSSGTVIPAEQAAIFIGIILLISSFVCPVFVDRCGRRILLFISGLGTLISLSAIGLYFHIKNNGGNCDPIYFLPILSLVIYTFSFSCGFAVIPFTILGEIFAPNMKAAASTLSIAVSFTFGFTTSMCFPSLSVMVGEAQSFWFFAVFCALSLFFVYFFVPETKGKSLSEIQDMLK